MEDCKHAQKCATCAQMRVSIKKEVIAEILPLFSSLLGGRNEVFSETLSKLQEEFNCVPENWEQNHESTPPVLMINDLKTARKDVLKIKSDLADLPVMRQQLREICHSENSEREVTEVNEIEEVTSEKSLKENFLKERIEALEDYKEKSVKREEEQNKENHQLREENKELRGKMNKIEITREDIKREIDAVKQYQRRDIGQLINVDYFKGENVKEVVIDFLHNTMGLTDIHASDISTCHRVFTPKGSEWNGGSPLYDPECPPIYVKCIARDGKNYILNNKSNLRGLKNSNGYRYFVSENLTPYRRALFKKTKESLNNFRFVWTKEGQIMARKHHKSRVYKINTFKDLEAIQNY